MQQEIDSAATEGRLSTIVKFEEGRALDYLQAVIKEALRLHPAGKKIPARPIPATVSNIFMVQSASSCHESRRVTEQKLKGISYQLRSVLLIVVTLNNIELI